jgi:hypothetical protein
MISYQDHFTRSSFSRDHCGRAYEPEEIFPSKSHCCILALFKKVVIGSRHDEVDPVWPEIKDGDEQSASVVRIGSCFELLRHALVLV